MHHSKAIVAVALAALALAACGHSIQPRNGPEPFRGEFPLPTGYDAPPYDPYYGEPGYGEPPYGPDYGYDEPGYAAPEDYKWHTAGEYRRSIGEYEHREHREERREFRPEHHAYLEGHAEYREHETSGHAAHYVYKYKLKDRAIKLGRYHLRKVHETGYAAPPVAYAFSDVIYEQREIKTYHRAIRAKVKKRRVHRAPPVCICRYEKRVEDLRGRMHDSRVRVEGFDKGYRLEMPADILFALDSDALKPSAQAIISSISGGLKAERGAVIDVNGYADTSGTEEHNELLSQSRAVAVADALVREGLDADRINPRGYGESLLRVPTPDGVREPANRRVEIVVQPKES